LDKGDIATILFATFGTIYVHPIIETKIQSHETITIYNSISLTVVNQFYGKRHGDLVTEKNESIIISFYSVLSHVYVYFCNPVARDSINSSYIISYKLNYLNRNKIQDYDRSSSGICADYEENGNHFFNRFDRFDYPNNVK